MSSLEEKKSELERVLGVFQNYIEGSELLDVVYSKKFGYVLLGLPAADSIDDSDVTRLEDPETLVKEIYQNLAYDFMEQEGDVAMSSLEEKKSELERVLGVFQNYIEGSELLDVVYSKKFGYVLLGLPAADSIDDSDVTRLEDPETLVKEIYQNLAYDFMEQEGHSEDYTEATNLEKRAMREWMKEYTDQLPEYNYLLDELLG